MLVVSKPRLRNGRWESRASFEVRGFPVDIGFSLGEETAKSIGKALEKKGVIFAGAFPCCKKCAQKGGGDRFSGSDSGYQNAVIDALEIASRLNQNEELGDAIEERNEALMPEVRLYEEVALGLSNEMDRRATEAWLYEIRQRTEAGDPEATLAYSELMSVSNLEELRHRWMTGDPYAKYMVEEIVYRAAMGDRDAEYAKGTLASLSVLAQPLQLAYDVADGLHIRVAEDRFGRALKRKLGESGLRATFGALCKRCKCG